MQLDDEEYVLQQYRTTENLETRISVWSADEIGHSPQEVALSALREISPRRVLEVGSGNGSFAFRIVGEIGCEVIGLDSSAAMVTASRTLGVETILGDARALPFPDASFDAVVAAWMLYHVNPLEQALSELARVLHHGGRLIAITNGRSHMAELWSTVGADHNEPSFSVENGADFLSSYFSKVESRSTATYATFSNRDVAAKYLRSLNRNDLVDELPPAVWPLRARGSTAVFVAQR